MVDFVVVCGSLHCPVGHFSHGHCCKCCWWRISWSSVVVAVLCSSQMALQDAELWQMCMCGRCTVSVGSDGFYHQVLWLLHSLPFRLRFEMPIVVGGGHYYGCYSWWYISWSSDVTAAFSAYEIPVVMGGHYYGWLLLVLYFMFKWCDCCILYLSLVPKSTECYWDVNLILCISGCTIRCQMLWVDITVGVTGVIFHG